MHKPELVAPAGSWEAFLAGLEAGADAFYLGFKRWSARGRARNFALEDLERLVPLAHEHGRRVYVALNTLLQEAEVPRVVGVVADLVALGVDAVILQDLGLWRVCREVFPRLRLHASTQMSVHNAAGARALERMGFSRVVLARECTLPEIAAVRRETGIGLEVFVHGALCFSLSGQCLASGLLLGRSANRGWCAQPCRWGLRPAGGDRAHHPLSTADLCLVEHVWELARAGVEALKIEGRLRGADYVHAVVRAYRKVLDAPEADRAGALGAAREILAATASRSWCEGYVRHPRPRDVLRLGAAPALGERVGRVHRWKDGHLVLAVNTELRRGDRIRIQTGARETGVALSLRAFRRERVPGGWRYALECPQPVRRGDPVFRVKTAAAEALEQRLAREAEGLRCPRGMPMDLTVRFEGGRLRAHARCGAAEVDRVFPVPSYPAERHPLDYHTLRQRFGRLGNTPYRLAAFRVEGEIPPVVIPPSRLNEIRRALVADLEAARARWREAAGERAARLRPAAANRSTGRRLWVRAETAQAVRAVPPAAVHRLVLLVTKETLRLRKRLSELLGGPDRIVWELPAWIAQGDVPLYRARLERLAAEGFREMCLTNLGHLALLDGLAFVCHAGRELHLLNGWTAAAFREMGFRTGVISPETGRDNLEAMASAGWPLRPIAYVYGHPPLFLSRLDPAPKWPPGELRETVDGRRFEWSPAPRPLARHPWTRVYAAEPLNWLSRVEELREMGIADFLVDLAGPARDARTARGVVRAFLSGQPLEGGDEANYVRGLL